MVILLDPSIYFVQYNLSHWIVSTALGMSISCTLGQSEAFSRNLDLGPRDSSLWNIHLKTVGHNSHKDCVFSNTQVKKQMKRSYRRRKKETNRKEQRRESKSQVYLGLSFWFISRAGCNPCL